MLHAHGGAVQTDAHRRSRLIELRVIRLGENYIGDRVPRHRLRNQLANQQPSDAGVSVWKMEEVFLRLGVGNSIAVHSLSRCRVQFQPFETWQVKSPRGLRRDRGNAYAKQAVG